MDNALRIATDTFFAEALVGENGSLVLLNQPIPPLTPGEKVRLTIYSETEGSPERLNSLRGTVTRYDDPFGPAAAPDEWEAL